MSALPRDTEALPPTDNLVMEVLAARARCGERSWPFSTRLRTALGRLEADGYIGFKSGAVEYTYQAWLTDAGRAAFLVDGYELPVVAEAVGAADARWINLLSAGVALAAGDINHAEFRRRTRPAEEVSEDSGRTPTDMQDDHDMWSGTGPWPPDPQLPDAARAATLAVLRDDIGDRYSHSMLTYFAGRTAHAVLALLPAQPARPAEKSGSAHPSPHPQGGIEIRWRLASLLCRTRAPGHHHDDFDYCDDCLDQADLLLDNADLRALLAAAPAPTE